ncbi:MAG: RnfABCDGE type electron transport complex subunit B [Candidatus Auribacterota bacterium]|nr:RnfABCDGE type electron transport complex subunit B [Candidatus Auribacterota bacterium]
MAEILAAVLTITIMGLIFGVGLAIGSRVFFVHTDPRLEKIEELLPQLNCGACGYGGCADCARALLNGEAEPSICPVASPEVHKQIAEVLGLMLEEEERIEARIFCRGGYDAAKRYEYEGISTCAAANQLGGGVSACDYGCLRYYTCVEICPFDAIEIDERGNPVVIPEKCRACKLCVENCPREIIRMVPKKSKVEILCSSHSPGKVVVKVCSVGCISCGKCVKECPVEAITIKDNLAVIDYEKCINCGKCIEVCPRKIIERIS